MAKWSYISQLQGMLYSEAERSVKHNYLLNNYFVVINVAAACFGFIFIKPLSSSSNNYIQTKNALYTLRSKYKNSNCNFTIILNVLHHQYVRHVIRVFVVWDTFGAVREDFIMKYIEDFYRCAFCHFS